MPEPQPTFKCGSCQAAHEDKDAQLARARARVKELEDILARRKWDPIHAPRRAA